MADTPTLTPDAIRKMLQSLVAQRDAANEAIEALERMLSLLAYGAIPAMPVAVAVPSPSKAAGYTDDFARLNLGEAAKAVLSEAGRPLTNRQIAEELQRRGYPSKSQNMANNVGTSLWREINVNRDESIIRDHGSWAIKSGGDV